ncbi:hypothetical protein LJK88_33665 [Paenibacillus sp. P26]|nr:hypothetical protein LJK88_33665 [Paenibacillus sp. P26]
MPLPLREQRREPPRRRLAAGLLRLRRNEPRLELVEPGLDQLGRGRRGLRSSGRFGGAEARERRQRGRQLRGERLAAAAGLGRRRRAARGGRRFAAACEQPGGAARGEQQQRRERRGRLAQQTPARPARAASARAARQRQTRPGGAPGGA